MEDENRNRRTIITEACKAGTPAGRPLIKSRVPLLPLLDQSTLLSRWAGIEFASGILHKSASHYFSHLKHVPFVGANGVGMDKA